MCFQCEVKELKKAPEESVGIDLGLKDLAILSTGEKIENGKHYREQEAKLATAQRSKSKKRTAKIHRKIARKRKDGLHKATAQIAQSFSKIVVGNLRLVSGKSVNDASHGFFKTLLEYKVRRRQGELILVNEAYTTQTCSNCLEVTGPKGIDGLSVREWVCAHCGQMHDRDINSARNILRLGTEVPLTLGKPQAS